MSYPQLVLKQFSDCIRIKCENLVSPSGKIQGTNWMTSPPRRLFAFLAQDHLVGYVINNKIPVSIPSRDLFVEKMPKGDSVMGFVLQSQRRAIEALVPFAKALSWPEEAFTRNVTFFRVGQENWSTPLICAGISEGIGTCSDLHGVDVAILQYYERGVEEPKQDATRLSHCKYAVLLWPSGTKVVQAIEDLAWRLQRVDPTKVDPLSSMRTVELLEFSSHKGDDNINHVYLVRTGLISSYVPV